ncbi:MAG TPA: AAA family ATPase [Candidatus Acidoferrales bacterium]|jgi:general secretion pathway protein A|nr:AAA family ATPase [Candidatus Acidoferrales bacterium]
MYKNFFGLRENPFNVNPDPRFLYQTPQIQEALEQLTYGVQSRKGLILLTGEVGTGKTTLINYLLDWLRHRNMPTAFIFNSHLSANHLFDFILNDFGIPADFKLKGNMLLQLNQWLIERFRTGWTPVLIVDEAQGLSFELLEEIRLLLNLETASEKLLQIVLVGQPELDDKLRRPEMRQLRQRISLRCSTSPLSLAEAHGYIADRLRIAGAAHGSVFASESVEAVHFYSRGIPRVMNLLCEHALINAYVEQLNPVPPKMVEEAARDFLMDEFRPVTSLPGAMLHLDDKPNSATSEFAPAPDRSLSAEGMDSLEDSEADTFTSPPVFAEEESAPAAEYLTATSVLERLESGAPKEHLETSFSVLHLVPASPELHSRQSESAPAANSSAGQSECVAEMVATMERMLAASSASRPRPELSKAAHEQPAASMREQAPASASRLFSLESMNRIPHRTAPARTQRSAPNWKARWSLRGSLFWPAIITAWWTRVSTAISPKARESLTAAQELLSRWALEFRRDWKAMINNVDFPQMKTSVRHWLRQPLSSKPMSPGKNQPV